MSPPPLATVRGPLRARLVGEADRVAEERAAVGVPTYPVAALLILLASSYGASAERWPLLLVAVVVPLSLLRGLVTWRGEALRARSRRLWRACFGVTTTGASTGWAGVCAWALVTDGPTSLVLLALMCAAAFPASATVALAPDLTLVRIFNLSTMTPLIVGSAVVGGVTGWLMVGLFSAFLVYQLASGKRHHQQYWEGAIDRALREAGEERNELLAAALAEADEIMVITDAAGAIEWANPAFEQLAGADAGALQGRPPTQVISVRSPAAEEAQSALRERRPWSGEVVVRSGAGAERHLDASVFPVRRGEDMPEHYVWMARDVTDEKQLRAQLAWADRMASVGTLAAGVAHEINNPMTYVSLNVDHLEAKLGRDDAEIRQTLDELRDGTRRVRRTVRELLLFSRGGPPEGVSEQLEAVDLRDALGVAARLAGNEIRHRARLRESYGHRSPVLGREEQLVQVFVNLFVNAAQAIDGQPRGQDEITVTTREQQDGRVIVEVADTGPGVPVELRERIFEPFFTTKPAGDGTGLGLSNSLALVRSFGGSMSVGGWDGGGARVVVELAAAERAPRHGDSAPREPSSSEVRGARILVVDDEPAIGRALRRALDEHEVVLVEDGREAVRRWTEERFDLMVCDLMMPGFTGMDVHRELARSSGGGEDRIVFMTGGAFTEGAREFLASVPNAHLDKPLDMTELRRLVGRYVEQRAA